MKKKNLNADHTITRNTGTVYYCNNRIVPIYIGILTDMPSIVARGERRHYVDGAASNLYQFPSARTLYYYTHTSSRLFNSVCPFDSAEPFAIAIEMSIVNRKHFYYSHFPTLFNLRIIYTALHVDIVLFLTDRLSQRYEKRRHLEYLSYSLIYLLEISYLL